tara:strand:- start:3396 stop:4556 length:1161 start_codon:yes stop_codon:yes gene_type:complete
VKIIFLIDSTFSSRDYERFGIESFLANNIRVQLWDFRKLYEISYKDTGFETDISLSIKGIETKVFLCFDELNKNINLDGAFVFDKRNNFDKIYSKKWFKNKGAIIVTNEQGLIPLSVWTPRLADRLKIIYYKLLRKGFISLIFAAYKKILLNNDINQNYSDIRVCSGNASKPKLGEFEIRSHAYDYDIFLDLKNSKQLKRNYALFLDCAMTNHPDYQKLNIASHCSEEEYFPLLRTFFDKVENQTGLRIIIAIHPRIKIDDKLSRKYGHRELVINKTAELVKDASLILNHDSTAINFVALWNIPMIIFTTDQIEKAEYSEMESQDQFLQINRLNINKPYDDINFIEIAKTPLSQYNHYIEKFIKVQGTPSLKSADILIQGLKNYVQ